MNRKLELGAYFILLGVLCFSTGRWIETSNERDALQYELNATVPDELNEPVDSADVSYTDERACRDELLEITRERDGCWDSEKQCAAQLERALEAEHDYACYCPPRREKPEPIRMRKHKKGEPHPYGTLGGP